MCFVLGFPHAFVHYATCIYFCYSHVSSTVVCYPIVFSCSVLVLVRCSCSFSMELSISSFLLFHRFLCLYVDVCFLFGGICLLLADYGGTPVPSLSGGFPHSLIACAWCVSVCQLAMDWVQRLIAFGRPVALVNGREFGTIVLSDVSVLALCGARDQICRWNEITAAFERLCLAPFVWLFLIELFCGLIYYFFSLFSVCLFLVIVNHHHAIVSSLILAFRCSPALALLIHLEWNLSACVLTFAVLNSDDDCCVHPIQFIPSLCTCVPHRKPGKFTRDHHPVPTAKQSHLHLINLSSSTHIAISSQMTFAERRLTGPLYAIPSISVWIYQSGVTHGSYTLVRVCLIAFSTSAWSFWFSDNAHLRRYEVYQVETCLEGLFLSFFFLFC